MVFASLCRIVQGRVVAAEWRRALLVAVACAAVGTSAVAREPWRDMDYGPCLAATYEAAPGNLAYKGLAVRIDPGPGGVASGKQFVLFDTDTLRYVAGWSGPGFIDWQNIAFDGQHVVHPKLVGNAAFQNHDAPGWSNDNGSFDDERFVGRDGQRYGPLPRNWAQWKGHYRHGSRVMFTYQVGSTTVLDHPSSLGHRTSVGFLRTLNLGARPHRLIMQVASASPSQQFVQSQVSVGSTPLPVFKLIGRPDSSRETTDSPAKLSEPPHVTTIAAISDVAPIHWRLEGDQLRLELPSGSAPARLQIVFAALPPDTAESAFAEILSSIPPPEDLSAWTTGGPTAWPETITASLTPIGPQDGALTAEAIGLPDPNPFRSWMRTSGFDFFADGDRAAVCTWQGDVWIVRGLSGSDTVAWTRIASGLFQPLGLKIVDDAIYVTGRDQLTHLVDVNGDGATDFYRNFNNDAQVTSHFHEFAMDLQTDAAGNFYYAKAARHALDALVPQHGTLIRVSPDGRQSEIVASGFRAPNGICVNDDGTFFVSDQEGHWTPKNRINWVRPGGFYGNMMGWHEGRSANDFEPPICWIHNDFDRSPAQQLRVPTGLWGPLDGQLLNLSYGTGEIHLVLKQPIGTTLQAGVIRLPLAPFPTGIMRGRFHPTDQRLYLCGLFGWSSNQTSSGGMYRVRYHPSRPMYLPTALRVDGSQITLTFAISLDASATDVGNYAVSQWNYRRTADYGSNDYRLSNPRRQGRDRLRVQAARLADDERTLTLELADLKPSMQLELRYRLRARDGTLLDHRLQQTLSRRSP